MNKDFIKIKIKEFWQKYESRIVLILGFVLVATISFEAGILQGRKMPQSPIVIEKPAENRVPEAPKAVQEEGKAASSANITDKNCAFVGSKNSDKYHLPTCSYAKNIKPENLTCFSSTGDAATKGYVPDKNCIK